jgi:hypothetical protein
MKPLRFSLCGLLILTALLAAFCYWRDRPRQIANRFVAAIEAGEYELADFIAGDGGFSVTELAGSGGEFWVGPQRQTVSDWLSGQCHVRFIGKGAALGTDGMVTATAFGVDEVDVSRKSYGGISPPRK